jgi:hypothetical protein
MAPSGEFSSLKSTLFNFLSSNTRVRIGVLCAEWCPLGRRRDQNSYNWFTAGMPLAAESGVMAAQPEAGEYLAWPILRNMHVTMSLGLAGTDDWSGLLECRS